MPKVKKPRKQYKPKPCVMPLGMRNHQKMEFPGYAASLALGQGHLQEQHIYDLLSNADLVRRIARDDDAILPLAQSMVEAIASIQERHQRIGMLGVTGDEMQVLRTGIGKTMDFLREAPNSAIEKAARAALSEFDKTGVLRV